MASSEQEQVRLDDDAVDIRAQLKLAQERLATYQKFDRDIAENVRRSSELMLEAMQVRDRMDQEASEQARARQERLASRLGAMESDLAGIQAQIGTMLERVATLRGELATEQPDDAAEEVDDTPGPDVIPATPPSEEPQAAEDEITEEPAPPTPRQVELIAHGMTRAASALALQSHLRGLPQVEAVDAREFSSGILRLQLRLTGDLPDDDVLGWEGEDEVTVIRHQDDAIELRLGE